MGAAVYAARKKMVEPVIGQFKHDRGFRQFMLRGVEKVRGEWSLICTTHNILKLYRLQPLMPRQRASRSGTSPTPTPTLPKLATDVVGAQHEVV